MRRIVLQPSVVNPVARINLRWSYQMPRNAAQKSQYTKNTSFRVAALLCEAYEILSNSSDLNIRCLCVAENGKPA